MASELKSRLQTDMTAALKAADKKRLGTIRMALAEIKQREIDRRGELDDPDVLAVLDKMVKQRRDSRAQFESAGRSDLAAIERFCDRALLLDHGRIVAEGRPSEVIATYVGG